MEEGRKGEAWELGIKWGTLGGGLLLWVAGGIVKVMEVKGAPGLFEYVFFQGTAYVVMIVGVVLVIVSLGHHLFFGPEEKGEKGRPAGREDGLPAEGERSRGREGS